jgi:hypothetical protein
VLLFLEVKMTMMTTMMIMMKLMMKTMIEDYDEIMMKFSSYLKENIACLLYKYKLVKCCFG